MCAFDVYIPAISYGSIGDNIAAVSFLTIAIIIGGGMIGRCIAILITSIKRNNKVAESNKENIAKKEDIKIRARLLL